VISESTTRRWEDWVGRYRRNGQGKAAFHPAVMLAVLIYAHARGIRSSRRIERMCVLDVGFRVLARNLRPDHATIARFVVRHEKDLEGLFAQALRLCAEAGLVNVGVIAIDGTKIAASASWSANKTEAAPDHLVAEQTRTDAAEDAVHGDARGDELPPELFRPADRLKRLQAAKQRLAEERETAERAQQAKIDAYEQRKERGGRLGRRPLDKPRPPTSGKPPRANTTDPDSRAMRGKAGLVQGYNGQAAVTKNQMIVGTVLTQKPTDITLTHDVLDEFRTQLTAAGLDPAGLATVLADAWSGTPARTRSPSPKPPACSCSPRSSATRNAPSERTPAAGETCRSCPPPGGPRNSAHPRAETATSCAAGPSSRCSGR